MFRFALKNTTDIEINTIPVCPFTYEWEFIPVHFIFVDCHSNSGA